MEALNYLSKNIRFLRKQRKLSQHRLAHSLEIKRSNIAAYETKNVEPRLSLISKMAEFFGVSLAQLICEDLEDTHRTGRAPGQGDGTFYYDRRNEEAIDRLPDQEALEDFRRQSYNVRKMLEGFRVFYQYKADLLKGSEDSRQTGSDVENFLIFIDHMLSYNEDIIRLFDPQAELGSDSEPVPGQSVNGFQPD